MTRILRCAALLAGLCALAGCGTAPAGGGGYGVCNNSPGSFDCQVERYMNAY